MKTKLKTYLQAFLNKSKRSTDDKERVKYQQMMENENNKNMEKEEKLRSNQNQPEPKKPASFIKVFRSLFQRFLVVVVRFIMKYLVYGERGLTVSGR